ncbi:MAG: heavy metal translocating P-type ATPase [Bdellovibrio sp.]|nr:heavy metal translocating P-type ATPase [Bdellovibrio sp.]
MELVQLSTCNYCGIPTQGNPYCCEACKTLDTQVGPLKLATVNPYSFLDGDEFREQYRQPQRSSYQYLIFCEGLHCSSCVHLLEKLPEFCPEVLDARVNFAQSTVAVNLKDNASLGLVAQSIAELGYTPRFLSPSDDLQDKYKLENRSFLKRIAVAGFCAGNTMLFVIPVYAGLAGTWAQTFNFISFLLFLPILLYSAMPFYQGALNSLKYKVINVDLPITIAMLSGFALSTYNLFKGEPHVYFDSTASFMFLILSARYLLKRIQQNYLAPARASSLFKNESYACLRDGQELLLPWDKIQEKDVLVVKQNQSLPADCELLSTQATLDLSLFNGESLPKVFSQGMMLFAGSKLVSGEAQVRALLPFKDSKLGSLFKQLDQEATVKSRFVSLTDRLAQKLIITVFSIAILFFVAYSFVDPSEAFQRSLALIVLACPCALAFGSPLTLGLALKKAQTLGILIKNANTFERILKIKNIFFDKTGTLTEGSLSLVHSAPIHIPEDTRRIILSLEASSYHPIAFALRKAWAVNDTLAAVSSFHETLGQGVRGKIGDDTYELRPLSETTHDSEIGVEFFKNSESQCRLYFSDSLREDSAKIVAYLQRQGIDTHLLSGDKNSRVKAAAVACNISLDNTHGELFPEDKKVYLKVHPESCMIGDGANDALSLQEASVGIAVKGSVDLSLQHADVYFSRGGLSPLLDLITLAQKTRTILVRNLSISLVYNTVGGVLALLGFINPMMAAILMPISSVVIILSSLWGFR